MGVKNPPGNARKAGSIPGRGTKSQILRTTLNLIRHSDINETKRTETQIVMLCEKLAVSS